MHSRPLRVHQGPLFQLSDPTVTAAPAAQPVSLGGRDLAFLIGINLIWGLNLIASKIGVGQFPPIFFTALRFGSKSASDRCNAYTVSFFALNSAKIGASRSIAGQGPR